MLRFVAILSLLAVAPPICVAELEPTSGQTQESRQQAPRPVDQPILKKVFRAQFSKDQLAQFKEAPTLEQLVQSMSPEQRQAARAGLAGLEAKAKTPAELAQIARGYLMLDEQGPDRGQDVFRVAAQLEQSDPGSPAAPTIAAEAFYKMGDYPSAAKLAEEALQRDPDDPGAIAIYNLSAGRNGRAKGSGGRAEHVSVDPSGPEDAMSKRQDSEQTITPVFQGKRNAIVVPSLAKTDAGAESKKPVSLPPLPLAMALFGIGFVGYGIYRARKSDDSEDSSLESAKGTKYSPEDILDIADRRVADAKTFVQDHPVVTVAGAILVVALAIRFIGPPIAAMGGGAAAGTEIVVGRGGTAALGRAGVKVLPMPAVEAWWAKAVATLGGGSLLLMKGHSQDDAPKATDGARGGGGNQRKDDKHPHGVYEGSPKHGASPRGGAGGKVSKAPGNPQEVLDESIQIKETSKRRVGIDYQTGEFNIFSETEAGKWHGFSMRWEELGVEAKNALIRAGKVTRRGRIIKP